MVTKPNAKLGFYGGVFGDSGCPTPQKGIAAYTISPNYQNPYAGILRAATFNTFRRFRHQVLYVAPPFLTAYALMNWAVEKNEYLNSKAGRIVEGVE